jgi:hypothetical protein
VSHHVNAEVASPTRITAGRKSRFARWLPAAVLAGAVSLLAPAAFMSAPAGASTTNPSGYTLVAANGGVYNFGGSPELGGPLGTANAAIVGVASSADGAGYWVVSSNGGVFSYGDAPFLGSLGALKLNSPIVGIVGTPDGKGYYLVAADGGVFTFGDAHFQGSLGSLKLSEPITGISLTSDGLGYYLLGSDGGVFAFGDAQYAGNLLDKDLNGIDGNATAIAANPTGPGYLIATADGDIFAYGGAPFFSSPALSGITPTGSIVGLEYAPDGTGYWAVGSDGGVYAFDTTATGGGHASYYGSVPGELGSAGLSAPSPIVGFAAAL